MFDRDNINPLEDGVTHTNACSHCQTKLGSDLSNWQAMEGTFKCLLSEPIEFKCLEGAWYYIKLVLAGESLSESTITTLTKSSGYAVKRLGQSLTKALPKSRWDEFPEEKFKNIIRATILNKCIANPDFVKTFVESKLPIVHYYVFGNEKSYNAVMLESQQWPFEWYSHIRDEILRVKPKSKKDVIKLLEEMRDALAINEATL